MQLDKLWRESGLASESRLAEIHFAAWHKDDGNLTLEEAFYLCDSMLESFDLPPLSLAALSAAKALAGTQWALCGGTAVNKLLRPRTTVDVDILAADRSTAISLLLRTNEFFQAQGNKLKHASGGEIDLLDTESGYWKAPKQVARHALATATKQRVFGEDMPMVTPAGLIATKLARAATDLVGADQDKVDIVNVLIKHGHQDLSEFGVTQAMQEEYERLIARAAKIRPEP
jgi:hypothetical protein